MARTNFAGPINEGSVQQNTGTEFTPSKTRNVGFVTSTQSFYFDYTSINFTADDNRFFTASTSTGAQTLLTTEVSGISINGNRHAMTISFSSAGNDSGAGTTVTVVGTDVFNQAQTETLTLATAGNHVQTAAAFNTLSTVTFSAAPLGAGCKCGLLVEDTVTFLCQSPFNGYPLGQTSTSVDKNLANNINIPAWSRITGLRWLNVVAFDPTTLLAQFGANQHTAADTWTLDMDYFAGETGDIKALGHFNMPVDLDVATGSQTLNILNVSGSDTTPYENDKLLAITVLRTGTAPTAGEAIIYVDYVQGVNNTN
jgi:hypothetical protein